MRTSAKREEAKPVPGAVELPPLQRVGVLVEVPHVLRDMNVNPELLLAIVGVQPEELSDIEGRIPFPIVSDLIMKCAQATGRTDFPIVLGSSGRLRHLGIVGQLLYTAADFGSALLDFVGNHPRYVRGASTYLIDWGSEGVLIGHRVHHPGLNGAAAFSVGATTFGASVFRELCGVEPTRALLSLPQPEDLSPYQRALGRAKLTFRAGHFGLVYPRAALAKPIPTADASRHSQLRTFVAERWNFLQPDLLDRVMRILVPSVLAGTPSLKATAESLAMHPRTLNRALQLRGLSFRDAVKRAHLEMASQFLRDTQTNVSNLSRILGYSEVSAFTRFFKGMAGLSPSVWKQREEIERGSQPRPSHLAEDGSGEGVGPS